MRTCSATPASALTLIAWSVPELQDAAVVAVVVYVLLSIVLTTVYTGVYEKSASLPAT